MASGSKVVFILVINQASLLKLKNYKSLNNLLFGHNKATST